MEKPMNIRKIIAKKYLKKQYELSQEYLKSKLSFNNENLSHVNQYAIDKAVEHCKNAGIAYAQCAFVEFLPTGICVTDLKPCSNPYEIILRYNEFVEQMEAEISNILKEYKQDYKDKSN